jgi:hypothetical protein
MIAVTAHDVEASTSNKNPFRDPNSTTFAGRLSNSLSSMLNMIFFKNDILFSHHVYPSAMHTRFEHSLGTMHLGTLFLLIPIWYFNYCKYFFAFFIRFVC